MPTHRPSFGRADLIFLATLVIAAGLVYYRIADGLNYVWNWDKLPQFLFRFDAKRGRWVSNVLVWGFANTLKLSLWSAPPALVIGTAMGICRSSGNLFLRLVSGTYVEILRNLPPLVIIFIVYFFIGSHLLPLQAIDRALDARGPALQGFFAYILAPPGELAPFVSALFTMAVFEGAYIAEIIRAGIQSIERGQWEAAQSLGLSGYHTMIRIVLPQTFGRMLPPLAGQFISLIKDTAIVSVISVAELTFRANELMTGTLLTMEVWITVTAMYLILTLPCSLVVDRLERRAGRGR
jgi:polar amino acid transport system permease protein